jgi:regulatory protein
MINLDTPDEDLPAKDEGDIDPAAIRLAAMNYLARREHTRRELKQKLAKRFKSADLVDEQLERLADEGLQSDTRFAESFVRQRYNNGYGPLRIRQELGQKGVPDSDIEGAMSSQDYDWYASAKAVLERKFGPERAADLREKAKRSRFMQYRGFSAEDFQRLL